MKPAGTETPPVQKPASTETRRRTINETEANDTYPYVQGRKFLVKNTSKSIENQFKNPQKSELVQKRPDASKCFRMHLNASQCVPAGLNGSKWVRTHPKTSKILRKLLKKLRKLRKCWRKCLQKLYSRRSISDQVHGGREWKVTPI